MSPSNASLQKQVLQEYATMSANLEKIATTTAKLSTAQPILLQTLRPLEKRMGLVLTLFKASMWSLLVQLDEQNELEEQQQQQQARS